MTETIGERGHRPASTAVAIATYARPGLLRNALRSLQTQTRPPDEVIVAAWAEDLPTIEVVQELRSDPARSSGKSRIELVVTTENTVTAKENAGIGLATGEIVCFMDDDAAARPDWLERICAWYEDPSVGAVGGRDVVHRDDQEFLEPARDVGRLRWVGRLIGNHHRGCVGARDVDFLKGVNMSFRRALLPSIDERLTGPVPYAFEIDLGLHVRALGYRVVYDPEIVVDHYPTTDIGAASPAAWTVNRNQTYVLLKRLSLPRKLVFLAYTFLLGDRNTIGLARIPLLLVRDRWPAAAIRAHFSGKMAGVRAYAGLRSAMAEPRSPRK